MPQYTTEFIYRFWSKVNIIEDIDQCFVWKNATDKDGYGITSFKHINYKAHRIAYELTYGAFDRSLKVLHKCDNPPCCNSHHLFLGTDLDNQRDCVSKGRHVALRNENHVECVLSIEDVNQIREKYKTGTISQYRLAEDYSVSQSLISLIVNFKNRKHT